MTSEMDTCVAPLVMPKQRTYLLPAISLIPLLASILLLSLLYLGFTFDGSWFSSAKPLRWNGARMAVSKGEGAVVQKALIIKAEGQAGVAVASLTTPPFWAQDYAKAVWSVEGANPAAEYAMLWHSIEKPGRIFSTPLLLTRQGLVSANLHGDEKWSGQIVGLALTMQGAIAAPMTVNRVTMQPASAGAALAEVWDKWTTPQVWGTSTINYLDGEALEHEIALLPVMAGGLLLAILILLALARFGRKPVDVAVIWFMVFATWLALDTRWQATLFDQLQRTHQQFAGKSSQDKQLANFDGELFQFILQVRQKIPLASARVMLFSDDPYLRGRGTYHLYPMNVLSSGHMLPAAQFKPGDYLALVAKKDMAYDPGQQTLLWGNGQTLRAELLISSPGNLLVKVL
ncbi:MAG: hypothetical protein V4805_12405 [Pseudomonadota bacterium]